MDNRLMTRESEWVAYFIDNTEHIVAKMEQMKREYRPVLGGEHFLTDKEVAERLKISRRTLQEYRNEGRIAYIQLGGKLYIRKVILSGCSRPAIMRLIIRMTFKDI